jgi:hemerythrin superfamily protein
MATAKKTSRKSKSAAKSTTRAAPPSREAEEADQDAIELLTEDHRTVDELFEEYESSKDDASDEDKEQIVARICSALEAHATIEEEIFYPAAREAVDEDDADMFDEAEVEHEHIKMLVEELKTMTAGEELYDAKVKVLSEYVKHHVEEEEGEIFPCVRDTELDVEALGAEMQARKEELMGEASETTA